MLGQDKIHAADGFLGKFNTHIFHLNPDPRTNQYASSLIGRGIQRRQSGNETKGSSTQQGKTYGSNESGTYTLGDSENQGSARGSSGGLLLADNFNSGSNNGVGSNRSLGSQRGRNSGYTSGGGTSESVTSGFTDTMENLVEPNFFSKELLTGGPENNCQVTALLFRAGAKFKRPMQGVSDNAVSYTHLTLPTSDLV